jgi:Potential Queuosine, Q, salvage protein family
MEPGWPPARERSDDPLGVREACAWVVERARDVRVGLLDHTLDAIADLPTPEWDPRRHYLGPPERTMAYVLVLDTINFSFWGGGAGGYWVLAERLRDVFAAGDELARPGSLAEVNAERLRALLGDFPMLEERAGALRELGRHALESGGDGPEEWGGLVQDTAAGTARALATYLRSYADFAEYDGRRIPLLKRAQIAAADLNGAGVRSFPDLEALTCFPDYKLPQLLRHWGALAYSGRLAERIDLQHPLQPGEAAEVEIRAATVAAVERLREALAKSGRQLSSVQVDWIIWEAAQQLEGVRPYHRVRTIFY